MGSHKVIWVLFAGLALSAAACATDEEYYEGEIVPTRPVSKPSLDPSQPAELTGSTTPSEVPGINESVELGTNQPAPGERIDGAWVEELDTDGEYLIVHHPHYGTGIDHIQVLDQNGVELKSFDVRISPTQIDSNVLPR